MDLEAALASLAERDRWQARLVALQSELREVRAQRRRMAGRLRRLGRELKRLELLADEVVRKHAPVARGDWRSGGSSSGYFVVR